MANTATLTFAGDTDKLERAFARVGAASKAMTKQVEASGSKLGDGIKSAARAAVPAAAIAGAGLGAVMAVAIGAALAGGILLALGGGVLAAGIASAAKDPGVAAAFTGVKDKAAKAFADFGKPFQGPLTRAAQTFGSAIERLAPMINEVGAKLAPVIDKLAPALVAMVENALPALVGAAGQAGDAFGVLADILPSVGTWIGTIVTKLAEFVGWAVRNREAIGNWISTLAPIVGIFLAIIAVIKIWIAVQTMLNIALSLNPIGLIIIAIAALIAIIILIATKTTFFQDVWGAVWGWVKKTAMDFWDWLKALPDKMGAAFKVMGDAIFNAFAWPFRQVAKLWNNTIGKLSWSVPSWIPGIGGNTISAPQLPVFHQGGVMPGAPGSEGLALLQAGERVIPAGGGNTAPVVVQAGDSGLDRMFLSWLQGLLRANNLKLVRG